MRPPRWLTRLDDGSPASAAAVVLVCGESLDKDLRRQLREAVRGQHLPASVAIVEGLCSHPERVGRYRPLDEPAAIVAVTCRVPPALAAISEAGRAGLDPARIAALAWTPTSRPGPSDPGSRQECSIVTAVRAAQARAGVLCRAPSTGTTSVNARSMDRRQLIMAWRRHYSAAAHIAPDRCLGAHRCRACTVRCPAGAIDLAVNAGRSSRAVDEARCTSCGICVPTCPTRAIVMPGGDLDGVAAALDVLVDDGVSDVSIACRHRSSVPAGRPEVGAGGDRFTTLVMGSLRLLTPGAVALLGLHGLRVHSQGCEACNSYFRTCLSLADSIMQRTGGPAPSLGTTLYEPAATNEAIRANPGIAAAPVEHPFIATHTVQIETGLCTGCGACAHSCPAGALRFDADRAVVTVVSSRCLGCMSCVDGCPSEAVRVVAGIDGSVFTGKPVDVMPAREHGTCPVCQASLVLDPATAEVRRLLAAKGRPLTLIAEIQRCPQCRSPLLWTGAARGSVHGRRL